jgi:NAD(P)-dependent dehydrogenase (short-subunit alcohol dehydrogenase family)
MLTACVAAASSAKSGDVSFGIMDLNVKLAACRAIESTRADTAQDLASVASFAAAYAQPTLDVLICNAGIMNTPFALSKVSRSLQEFLYYVVLGIAYITPTGWH